MPLAENSSRLWDFRAARAHIEAKDKSIRDKTMPLARAVSEFVAKGDHLAIGGSLYTRPPMATLYEIMRQRIEDLRISRGLTGFEADLLVVGNGVDEVVSSWWSPGYAWGLSKVMRQLVEGGMLRFEEWSHSAMALRYKAAAMGLSFLPTLSMMGSDLEAESGAKAMTDPFTDEKVLLIPALYPDVGIVHVQRADRFGNAQIDGYRFMDRDIALASKKLIITAEKLVETELIRSEPDRTCIPFFCADAVVEVPYGSYPGECWGAYEADFEHMDHYAELVGAGGLGGVRKYLDEFVYSTKSFEDFLRLVGEERLEDRRRAFVDVAR